MGPLPRGFAGHQGGREPIRSVQPPAQVIELDVDPWAALRELLAPLPEWQQHRDSAGGPPP
jgi:hypothetical protein